MNIKLLFKRNIPRRGASSGPQKIAVKKMNLPEVIKILNFANYSENIKHTDYISWLKKQIKNNNLSPNVVVKEEKNENGTIKIIVIIRKFCFSLENSTSLTFTTPCFIKLKFKNNTFKSEKKFFDNSIFINLDGYGKIKLSHNIFKGIHLVCKERINKLNNKNVEIKNNEIPSIEAPTHAKVSFKRYNVINSINIFEENEKNGIEKDIQYRFSIRWTPYQKIDTRGKHAKYNRDSFITLKERAIRKGDKLQEDILNREIVKCESVLFGRDNENALRQDRWIMLFGKLSSDHGVSLIRPFWWLVGINFALSIITFYITETSILTAYYSYAFLDWIITFSFFADDFLNIFLEMLNPVSSLASTLEEIGACIDSNRNFITLFNIIQKAVFAILVYEMIRVGRRFTPK